MQIVRRGFRLLFPLGFKAFMPAAELFAGANIMIFLQSANYLFAKLNSDNKTNICHVAQASWSRINGTLWFSIRADRFLRNMVRAVVGTLVDVGRGRYSPEDFERIIAARDLSLSSGGAPAQGLFLWDVTYHETVFQRKAE